MAIRRRLVGTCLAAYERGRFSDLLVPDLQFQKHLAVLYAFRTHVAILVLLGLSDDQNIFMFQNRGPVFGLLGASARAVLATYGTQTYT